MRVVCLTHSSRPFLEARCTVNAFEQRFQSSVQGDVPALETLSGVRDAVPFTGALSLWQLFRDENRYRLMFLRDYRPDYKVQSAVFHEKQLLVYGSDRLEIFDQDFQCVATITDPWMVGGHTVFVDKKGDAWITCSPANAALRIDLKQQKVVERLVMPRTYGQAYELTSESDLHTHYVPTDLQPTHLNCAFPCGDELFVTLLRQGAVGAFDSDRNYRELVSGFRGCHGGKIDPDTGELLLTDSPSGIVWFFDRETGQVKSRLQMRSSWLHDTHPLGMGHYVAALSDRNCVQVVSRDGHVRCEIDARPYGESVMFVSESDIDQSWDKSLPFRLDSLRDTSAPLPDDEKLGPERAPQLDLGEWTQVAEVGAQHVPVISTERPVQYEYLCVSRVVDLEPGPYRLEAQLDVSRGGVMLGLLDAEKQNWLITTSFDAVTSARRTELQVTDPTSVQLVLSANNAHEAGAVEARVMGVSLRCTDYVPPPPPEPETGV